MFISQRQRSDLSPAGRKQLDRFAHLSSDQKQRIKSFIQRETWLTDVIAKHMASATAIMRLEFIFMYLGLYSRYDDSTTSLKDLNQSNPCVRATVEFMSENYDWLKPMVDYYTPLLKNSLLERNFRKLMQETEHERDSVDADDDFKQFLIQLAELLSNAKVESVAVGGARPKRKQVKVPQEVWTDLQALPRNDKFGDEEQPSNCSEFSNGQLKVAQRRVARRDGYMRNSSSRAIPRPRLRSTSAESISPVRRLGDKAFTKIFKFKGDKKRSQESHKSPAVSFAVEKLLRNTEGRQRPHYRRADSISPMRRLNAAFIPSNEFKYTKLPSKLFAKGNEKSYPTRRRESREENRLEEEYPARNTREQYRPTKSKPLQLRRYYDTAQLTPQPKYTNSKWSKWDSDREPTANEHYWYSQPNYEIRGARGSRRQDLTAATSLEQYRIPPRDRSSSDESKSTYSSESDDEAKESKLYSKRLEDNDAYFDRLERRETLGNIYTLNDGRLDSPYRSNEYYYEDGWY